MNIEIDIKKKVADRYLKMAIYLLSLFLLTQIIFQLFQCQLLKFILNQFYSPEYYTSDRLLFPTFCFQLIFVAASIVTIHMTRRCAKKGHSFLPYPIMNTWFITVYIVGLSGVTILETKLFTQNFAANVIAIKASGYARDFLGTSHLLLLFAFVLFIIGNTISWSIQKMTGPTVIAQK